MQHQTIEVSLSGKEILDLVISGIMDRNEARMLIGLPVIPPMPHVHEETTHDHD